MNKVPAPPSSLAYVATILTAIGIQAAGCGGHCAPIRDAYQQTVHQEPELTHKPSVEHKPVQFGVAIHPDLLAQLAATALDTTWQSGLKTTSGIDVGSGQTLSAKTTAQVDNLSISASDACRDCVNIGGELAGKVAVDVPQVGAHTARLGGHIRIVAPLMIRGAQPNGSRVGVDFAEARRLGKSTLSPDLSDLRQSWARVIEADLSTRLLDHLLSGRQTVDVLTIAPPGFGIAGFDFTPVEFNTDPATGAIFVGFSSNLVVPNAPAGLEPVTGFEDDQNLAVAFEPDLIAATVSLMMNQDRLSRTYTADGRPLRAGPARATVDGVEFSNGRLGELPMAVDFRVFTFGDRAPRCFRFTGRAAGKIALRGHELAVTLGQVAITRSSAPGLIKPTDWVYSEFVNGSKRVVSQLLDVDHVHPADGGSLSFKGLALQLRDEAVVLRGVAVAPRK